MSTQSLSDFTITPFPIGSDKFESIGSGIIRLHRIDDTKYELFIDTGVVSTGDDTLYIEDESHHPYYKLTVNQRTSLVVDDSIEVIGTEANIYGRFELEANSKMFVKDSGTVIFHPNSTFVINDNVNITVRLYSSLTIYGVIDVHLDSINYILNAQNINVDSAAVWNVHGIPYTNRTFSMTDYEQELRKTFINTLTSGEKNFGNNRLRYLWKQGTPTEPSHVIEVSMEYGDIPLGDFRLPLLGRPHRTTPNMQTVCNLVIKKNAKLHITESFDEFTYIRPELYIGAIIGNTEIPAECIVHGQMIADGKNALITVDRGGSLHIEEGAEVRLMNDAVMRCTHSDDSALFINGKLIIDDIKQINTFTSRNIVFGKNGKVIILNPSNLEKRILFTTPDGILASDLYRIFRDRIDNVEYHIPPNCGICIDAFFEQYFRSMTKWYGDRRFEKAIYDGILVFHEGAFIELNGNTIPWVNDDTTLLQISRLFKSYATDDYSRLQDVVNRLRYARCANIIFVLKYDDTVRELTLILDECNMKSIVNNPVIQRYVLKTDNDGKLFMRNRTHSDEISNLLTTSSLQFDIDDTHRVEFQLP
jgi:hypothetical protein